MTAPLAWLIDTNVVSEMMRPRPRVHHGLGGARRHRPSGSRPAPARPRRPVPRSSRRVVRGSHRRVDPGRCACVRTDHGGKTTARRGARRPCAGRLPCCGGCHSRARRRDPEQRRIPQYRGRDRRSLDRGAAMNVAPHPGRRRVPDWSGPASRSQPRLPIPIRPSVTAQEREQSHAT